MSDSLQSSFERIQITQQDLKGNSNSNGSSIPILPILSKSQEAASRSLNLSDLAPICVLVVGMAGSGKTTLMAALQRSLAVPDADADGDDDGDGDGDGDGDSDDKQEEGRDEKLPVGYCVNLDPATKLVPFGASIDIRDTVDYKEVMKQHRLG